MPGPISACEHVVHPMRQFMRENPQVLILLLICVILGIGTFVAVLVGLVGAGGGTVSGEPAGVVTLAVWL